MSKGSDGSDIEASNVELLSVALQDAMDARDAGLLAGPVVDEVAWRRAMARAVRADLALPAVGRGTGQDAWGEPCRSCQGTGLVEDLLDGELVDLPCTACNVDGAA